MDSAVLRVLEVPSAIRYPPIQRSVTVGTKRAGLLPTTNAIYGVYAMRDNTAAELQPVREPLLTHPEETRLLRKEPVAKDLHPRIGIASRPCPGLGDPCRTNHAVFLHRPSVLQLGEQSQVLRMASRQPNAIDHVQLFCPQIGYPSRRARRPAVLLVPGLGSCVKQKGNAMDCAGKGPRSVAGGGASGTVRESSGDSRGWWLSLCMFPPG